MEDIRRNEELSAAMASLWSTGPSPVEVWRQVSALPRESIKIDELVFANLFPDAAIDGAKFERGFPFISVGNLQEVFSLTPQGWVGRIPRALEGPAAYLWTVRRDGSFAYRERLWGEEQSKSGHPHIRPILALACATVALIPRLAEQARLEDSVTYDIAFEFGGMRGHGLVAPTEATPLDYGDHGFLERVWPEEKLRVELSATVAEMRQDIIGTSIRLVSEVTSLLAPSLMRQGTLRYFLETYHDKELKQPNGHRIFGVLDGYL